MSVVTTLLSRLSWRLLLYWAVLLGGLWGFAELADEVYEQEGFFFDEPVLAWFYGLVTPLRTRVALVLSTLGGVEIMIGLAVLLTVLLWFRSRREAFFFAASMTGASAIMGLTKVLLARPRPELFPDVDYWRTASPSFPSGHATGSAALALTLYLVVTRLAPRWRGLAAALGAAFALSVSASRLYLQVHYPSDILAGLALGCAWVLGVNAFYRYATRDRAQQNVLLRLPREVIAAYRQEAAARGVSVDEVVSAALLERHARMSGRQTEPRRAPPARVKVFKTP
jgi:membrane-associated phospholipid phosphatase